MDEDIISRIVLTPAERAVMIEQCETVKVLCDDLAAAIKAGDMKTLVTRWVEFTAAAEYMGSVLNAKTNKAIHNLYVERSGE